MFYIKGVFLLVSCPLLAFSPPPTHTHAATSLCYWAGACCVSCLDCPSPSLMF